MGLAQHTTYNAGCNAAATRPARAVNGPCRQLLGDSNELALERTDRWGHQHRSQVSDPQPPLTHGRVLRRVACCCQVRCPMGLGTGPSLSGSVVRWAATSAGQLSTEPQ